MQRQNNFPLEKKSNNNMPLVFRFKLQEDSTIRYMTVINGIPFYYSSGKFSTYPNTFFVFRGVSPSRWIRKCRIPKKADFRKFCKRQNINLEHLKSRLGPTQTICISASLGGGFWETPNGQLAKKYLSENYFHYFLQEEMIATINQAKLQAETAEIIIDSDKINECLMLLGARLPLDDHFNRIPTIAEQKLLNQCSQREMLSALSMMLNDEQLIDQQTITAIHKLSQIPELMEYALKVYLFEDREQTILFKKMILQKNKVILADLKGLDKLNECFLPDQYTYFLEHKMGRKVLRLIGEASPIESRCQFKQIELVLMDDLLKKKLLHLCPPLFKNKLTRKMLNMLFENKLLTRGNVFLLKKLLSQHNLMLEKLTNDSEMSQVKLDQINEQLLFKKCSQSNLLANTVFRNQTVTAKQPIKNVKNELPFLTKKYS